MPSKEKKAQKVESKLAILGLQAAGKTSIIKVLTQEFDMLTSLRPTQSVERTFIEILGKELVLWDFGGQEIYRNKYLSAPERYFDQISFVYYVVDVQDPKILDDSIKYFNAIFDNIKIYSPNAKIIILFHKNDPTLEAMMDKNNVKQRFIDAIVTPLEKAKFPVIIYKTSIYNHMSIITAFSQPFLGTGEGYKNISDMLQSFTENYGLGFSVLFSKNYFELGNSISDRIDVAARDALLKFVMKEYKPQVTEKITIMDMVSDDNKALKILIGTFGLKVGKGLMPFHLVIGYDEESVLEQEELKIALEKMIENLEKVLGNMDLFSIDMNATNATK
jgi:GTPase SAR1 family protein